jgi:DNA-directed primase/polymerase protein
VERGAHGARSFIVSSYDEFWRRYSESPAGCRHYYEIVREGSPCHLYFGASGGLG